MSKKEIPKTLYSELQEDSVIRKFGITAENGKNYKANHYSLEMMSETEKEKWILSQARLLSESEQQDFLMSLSGEKKIIYMPSQKEIEEFCEKVESGEIYLEYETH